MTLKTKYLFAPPESDDGLRIIVMQRLNFLDGKIDLRINSVQYHKWEEYRCLGPPDDIARAREKGEIDYEEAKRRYLEYLSNTPEALQRIHMIGERAIIPYVNITLMCRTEDSNLSHRKILVGYCKTLYPSLELIIK